MRQLQKDLRKFASKERAKSNKWFFKTGPGEYGEGDKFLGISVPDSRKVAKKYKDLSLKGTTKLLKSPWHEERLVALLILVERFAKTDEPERKEIYNYYLSSTKYINNWDLVDLSAHKIVGPYLEGKSKEVLYKLAKSKILWEKRISIISTFYYIANRKFDDALKIAKILLNDDHDLIHKAVGWMLREVGNRERAVEEKFLKKHYKKMPRTMLRYAIEKFPENLRLKYLKGEIN